MVCVLVPCIQKVDLSYCTQFFFLSPEHCATEQEGGTVLSVHKVRIFTEYHSVCPLVGIGTLPPPPPLSPASGHLPPGNNGGWGRHTRPRLRSWASPKSDDLRKSLALCLLCVSVQSVIGKLEDITVRSQLRKISTKGTEANVLRDG
jgi:hypothetical protein